MQKPVRKASPITDREVFTTEKFIRDKAYKMEKWFDGMTVDDHLRPLFQTPAKRYQLFCYDCLNFESLQKRFREAPRNLVIYQSNPRMGLGVALDLNSSLAATEVIDIYSACITRRSTIFDEKRFYSAVWSFEEPYRDYVPILANSHISFNAEKVGNFSRFFQDAPTQIELNRVTNISDAVKARIHTATLGINTAVYDGVPFSYLFAMRDIKGGEPLTWCYDENSDWFRMHDLKRYVMDHNGEIVGYLENNKIIFDYSQRFEEDVNQAIEVMSKVYAKPTSDNRAITAELDRLKDIMGNKKTTTEDKFIALQSQLFQIDTREMYNTKLKSLKQKIERLLEEYVAGREVEGLEIPKPKVTATATTFTSSNAAAAK